MFLVAFSLSSRLVLLLSEAEFLISVFEGIRVWIITVLSVSCGGGKMAVSPLGVRLDQLLGHLQGPRGTCHQPVGRVIV